MFFQKIDRKDKIILWGENAKPKKQGQNQFLEKEDVWYKPQVFEEEKFVFFEKDIFEMLFGFLPEKGSLQKMKLTSILE